MPRELRIEADGGSRGNPGVAGYGAVVRDASGAVLAERAAPLGKASNNVAEYSGLIAGLEAAAGIDPGAEVTVAMDSKLVVEQMSGRWKIKHEDMRRLALQARELAGEFAAHGGSVRYVWIPRERNKAADKLSNDGMDGLTVVRDAAQAAGAAPGVDGTDTELEPPHGAPPAPLRTSGEPTRIVLVRHGVTAFTEQLRLDGRGGPDPDLSETGAAQAQRAGHLVAELLAGAPARLTTSTLARARQTGAIIGATIGLEPQVQSGWDEQNFGDWDGLRMPDLIRDQPAAVAALRTDPSYRRPGGESHVELSARVLESFGALVAEGGIHIVVCHRKPILVVLAQLLGLEMDIAWRLAAAPGSLTGIEAWPDGAATIAFTNRT